MFSRSLLCVLLLHGAKSLYWAIPNSYSLDLQWTSLLSGLPEEYKHHYDFESDAQLEREVAMAPDGVSVLNIVTILQDRKYTDNKQLGVCINASFDGSVTGPILMYDNMLEEKDIVDGKPALKYTHIAPGWNSSVWVAYNDPKLADGTPLQLYNSYEESTKAKENGITHVQNFKTEVPADAFKLSKLCQHSSVTPHTTVPSPAPSTGLRWTRNWQVSECTCEYVTWTGMYSSEKQCMTSECPHSKPQTPNPTPSPPPPTPTPLFPTPAPSHEPTQPPCNSTHDTIPPPQTCQKEWCSDKSFWDFVYVFCCATCFPQAAAAATAANAAADASTAAVDIEKNKDGSSKSPSDQVPQQPKPGKHKEEEQPNHRKEQNGDGPSPRMKPPLHPHKIDEIEHNKHKPNHPSQSHHPLANHHH